jgi:hypothetical protein
MGFTTLKNTPITLSPNELATWSGWSIADGIAYHSGCFAGIVKLEGINVEANKSYVIEYEVKSYTSGSVYPIIGGVNGVSRTAVGEYKETIVVPVGATDLTVKFYSDGELSLKYFNVYPLVSSGEGAVSIGFKAGDNKYTSEYIQYPELMTKFINEFISFKDGKLWIHNKNETRNLLHGVQTSSKIKFICNIDPQADKLWFNLRLDATGNWFAPSITSPVSNQFPNGMMTKLKQKNFKLIDGKLWADILRDMNDPNFATLTPEAVRQLTSLFKGRVMQGSYLIIELECSDTTEIKLVSAEVYYSNVKRDF